MAESAAETPGKCCFDLALHWYVCVYIYIYILYLLWATISYPSSCLNTSSWSYIFPHLGRELPHLIYHLSTLFLLWVISDFLDLFGLPLFSAVALSTAVSSCIHIFSRRFLRRPPVLWFVFFFSLSYSLSTLGQALSCALEISLTCALSLKQSATYLGLGWGGE